VRISILEEQQGGSEMSEHSEDEANFLKELEEMADEDATSNFNRITAVHPVPPGGYAVVATYMPKKPGKRVVTRKCPIIGLAEYNDDELGLILDYIIHDVEVDLYPSLLSEANSWEPGVTSGVIFPGVHSAEELRKTIEGLEIEAMKSYEFYHRKEGAV
jgi:hypothetical protein